MLFFLCCFYLATLFFYLVSLFCTCFFLNCFTLCRVCRNGYSSSLVIQLFPVLIVLIVCRDTLYFFATSVKVKVLYLISFLISKIFSEEILALGLCIC